MADLPPPTDAELDALISARLALLGIDLSVLPESDPAAPADQTRVLASLRTFLRRTVPTISSLTLDVQRRAPGLYPAPSTAWQGEGE